MHRDWAQRQRRGAFTLIELLVVIGVIAVLAGIGLAVGSNVLNTGRDTLTVNTITRLNTVLTNLNAETDLRPREYAVYNAVDPMAPGGFSPLPIIDARIDGSAADASNTAEPSLGRFLKFASERVPGVETSWTQLDASIVRTSNIGTDTIEVLGAEVLDAHGNPIRFVHPQFDGGYGDYIDGTRDTLSATVGTTEVDFRRSYRVESGPSAIGDADEGICQGGTPYLYSAGADGDPGTRADNIYGDVTPTFPPETRDADQPG
ncbi:MAG: prepilin-type N-terminal cleavage/methylation domain-containing protein [Planctomycetota bacterium]